MYRVEFNTGLLRARFKKYQTQVPYATRIAVNETAQKIQAALQIETKYAFDRPTPFTVKAPMVRYAKKGEVVAQVFLRNEAAKGTPPVKYLQPEVEGGGRRIKRFERRLQVESGVLGPREYAMPADGAKLDRFGNLAAGEIVQILSQVKGFNDIGANETAASKARASASRKRYFATRAGQALKPGIYERVGPTTSARTRRIARDATKQVRAAGLELTVKANRIMPRGVRSVLIFTPTAPTFRPRFRFYKIARDVDARVFRKEFDRAMKKAIATAR